MGIFYSMNLLYFLNAPYRHTPRFKALLYEVPIIRPGCIGNNPISYTMRNFIRNIHCLLNSSIRVKDKRLILIHPRNDSSWLLFAYLDKHVGRGESFAYARGASNNPAVHIAINNLSGSMVDWSNVQRMEILLWAHPINIIKANAVFSDAGIIRGFLMERTPKFAGRKDDSTVSGNASRTSRLPVGGRGALTS